MSKSESEILEVLNGLGSKKLDLDILFPTIHWNYLLRFAKLLRKR